MTDYLDELAVRLRDGGVDYARASALLADLRAYLEESGADPQSEFGPVADFAAEFTGAGGGHEDTETVAEHWRWTTDTFADEELLNRYGAQGWEVVRVDGVGRFVCRRDTADPQSWEYRRELVIGRRAPVAALLAPEGWEPCGAWVVYQWFKRPIAASIGPAATVAEPPPAPERSTFFTRRGLVLMGVPLAAIVVLAIGYVVSGDAAGGLGAVVGGILGCGLGVLGVFAYARWQNRSR